MILLPSSSAYLPTIAITQWLQLYPWPWPCSRCFFSSSRELYVSSHLWHNLKLCSWIILDYMFISVLYFYSLQPSPSTKTVSSAVSVTPVVSRDSLCWNFWGRCHMSRVRCHISHVTCHMSPVTCALRFSHICCYEMYGFSVFLYVGLFFFPSENFCFLRSIFYLIFIWTNIHCWFYI